MNVLYISGLCSRRLQEVLADGGRRDPGYAMHKFNLLLIKGLRDNFANVIALSVIPITPSHLNRKMWNEGVEFEDNICIRYVPFVNIRVLRQIGIFLYTFFYVLWWGVKQSGEKCIVCDALNISQNMGALFASKLVGLLSVGVLTDMPGLMVTQQQGSIKTYILTTVSKSYMGLFSGYVFLTERMNEVINRRHRPYIVMEGMVDNDMQYDNNMTGKDIPNVVMYAGGLHEKYGLKMLVDAFHSLDLQNVTLHIYGNGQYVDELKRVEMVDSRIHYMGSLSNDLIVRAEQRASLLVNPRPTHLEFTKYSFPSKNMEYMLSGTPLLTTRLPGMPEEYLHFVYLFDEESTDGYARKLNEILQLTSEQLSHKGREAQQFVMQKKSNFVQGGRILELINRILKK